MLLWPASLDGFREEVNNTTEPPGNFARSMNAAFPLCHWERYWATNSQLSDSPFGKTLPGWEVVPMSSDRRTALIVLPVLLVLCMPERVLAQRASVTGTIQDSTGAVVPLAKVTAQNKATGISRSAFTADSGSFRISSLAPGIYDVRIEKNGFKTVEYSQVELAVDQVQNLDTTLVPSSIQETITVKGESIAAIDLNDIETGNTITSQQIENLPLILRDPYQLTLLSPGAIQSNSIPAPHFLNCDSCLRIHKQSSWRD